VEKYTKTLGPHIACPNKECDYKELPASEGETPETMPKTAQPETASQNAPPEVASKPVGDTPPVVS
jgi:hypothetical protein